MWSSDYLMALGKATSQAKAMGLLLDYWSQVYLNCISKTLGPLARVV